MPTDLPTEAEVTEMRARSDEWIRHDARWSDVHGLLALVEAWAPIVERSRKRDTGVSRAVADREWRRWRGDKP